MQPKTVLILKSDLSGRRRRSLQTPRTLTMNKKAKHSRLFKFVRNSIPYFPELRASHESIKSVAATVLMQQLEYWFVDHPNGFYKFLEPCSNEKYRQGDSWTEELAYTPDEFRAAFDCIGFRYRTKTEFTQSQDKFQGKFYCSYFDKRQELTYYFRNHETVEALLDGLIYSSSLEMENSIPRDGKTHLPEWQSPSLEKEKAIPRDGKNHPAIYTETTPEITSETTSPLTPQGEQGKDGEESNPEEDDKRQEARGNTQACSLAEDIETQIEQRSRLINPESKDSASRRENDSHFQQCDNSAFVGHGQLAPDGKQRPYNQMKGCYRSVGSDPWMQSSRNPLPEFKKWVYEQAIADGRKYSEANAAAEIRNDCDRAEDLWEKYQQYRQPRSTPRYEVVTEPLPKPVPLIDRDPELRKKAEETLQNLRKNAK